MDCYFRQYWRDSRLKFQGPMKTLSLSIKVSAKQIVLMIRYHSKMNRFLFLCQMLNLLWLPDTYFYNGKHSHVHTITVPNKLIRLTQEGDILYSMR